MEPLPPRNFSGLKNKCTVSPQRLQVDDGRRHVRNDVVEGGRNPAVIEVSPNQEAENGARPNSKRSRPSNLNNRSDINNGQFTVLRDRVYDEMQTFIQANETRPNFLIQLFRDLQQVTSDLQRQSALQALQDVVETNNFFLAARNNNRSNENRSNLNRSSSEARVTQLFDQLRENQNTIRQNIGNAPIDNLENPNISNLRDLANPPTSSRNNIDNEMRDLRSYFQGNLCDFGHGSSLKNPNVSNIRENLTESSLSEYERMNPKNVYLSLYDSLVEDLRRRSAEDDFAPPMDDRSAMNFGDRVFPVESNPRRFGMHRDRRENFQTENDFLQPNSESVAAEGTPSMGPRKSGMFLSDANNGQVEEVGFCIPPVDWPQTNENPFAVLLRSMSQSDPYMIMGAQSDDADLAEADQTRNDETSGAGSESDFVNLPQAEAEGVTQLDPDHALNNQEVDPGRVEDGYCDPLEAEVLMEADRNKNMLLTESNNNVFKTLNYSNRRVKERTEGNSKNSSPKVAKTKLKEVLDAEKEKESAQEENPRSERLMMDIAGALEHLIPQVETATEYTRPATFNEPEADEWELENGLDQYPTRLEKRDPANGDPT